MSLCCSPSMDDGGGERILSTRGLSLAGGAASVRVARVTLGLQILVSCVNSGVFLLMEAILSW